MKSNTFLFFRKHKKILGFLAVIVILIGSAVLIRNITPPIQEVSTEPWKNLTPGAKIAEVKDLTKGSLKVEDKDRSTIYSYQSPYPMFPNQVITETKTGTIMTTIEQLPPDTKRNLSEFLAEFGKPDFTAFYPRVSRTAQVNVFLNEGVIVVAHVTSGTVEEIWRTLPTTEEVFWKRFRDDFSKYPPGPESFGDMVEEIE